MNMLYPESTDSSLPDGSVVTLIAMQKVLPPQTVFFVNCLLPVRNVAEHSLDTTPCRAAMAHQRCVTSDGGCGYIRAGTDTYLELFINC